VKSPCLNVLKRAILKEKVASIVNTIKFLKLVASSREVGVTANKRTADEAFPLSGLPDAKRRRGQGYAPKPHPSVPEVIDLTGTDDKSEN
jgi:hypothetical protein